MYDNLDSSEIAELNEWLDMISIASEVDLEAFDRWIDEMESLLGTEAGTDCATPPLY